MKRLWFVLFLVAVSLTMFAVPRELVLLEVVTGTWCQYCPGAALACEDMIANGHQVGIIKYHGGDTFENVDSRGRITYYGITSYPTAKFDGTGTHSGGNATQSIYSSYLPRYNTAIAVDSPISMDIQATMSGTNINVTVTATKEENFDTNTPILHLALTESDIAFTWQNQTHLEWVCRKMYPNFGGTQIDFSTGNTVVVEYQIPIQAGWVPSNLELVGFVQNQTSKVVYQCSKMALEELSDLPPALNLTAALNTNTVALTWDAPAGRPLAEYSVFRDGVLLQNTTDTALTDTDVQAGHIYSYAVVAVYTGPDGESLPSNVASVIYPNPPNEGFESGDFTAFAWESTGTTEWGVVTTTPSEGAYCAKSGTITHSQQSNLEVDIDCETDGIITFYKKVSSESGYDFLEFYIDDVVMETWSGTVAWSLSGYPVTAGTHNFKWVYIKDSSVSSGQDCVWIDAIAFPGESEVPPALNPPTELLVEVSELNVVTLNWTAYAETEATFLGYKVFSDDVCVNPNNMTTATTYTFAEAHEPGSHSFYVTARYLEGESEPSNEVTEVIWPLGTGDNEVAYETALIGNFPNPFNPKTAISFSLKETGPVEINIYNITGQKVKTLVNSMMPAGKHTVEWSGDDNNRRYVSSGVFMYEMKTSEKTFIRKMIMLK